MRRIKVFCNQNINNQGIRLYMRYDIKAMDTHNVINSSCAVFLGSFFPCRLSGDSEQDDFDHLGRARGRANSFSTSAPSHADGRHGVHGYASMLSSLSR